MLHPVIRRRSCARRASNRTPLCGFRLVSSGSRRWVAICVIGGLGVAPTVGADVQARRADYDALLEWSFSAVPVELPPGGLRWQVDTAVWHLQSGRIWLQRPTGSGHVTGFVFEGSGRFRMTVPDPVELRQLRRFAEDPGLEELEESFDSMVVRGFGLPPFAALPDATNAAGWTANSVARDRHDHWLTLRLFDVDARVLAALGRLEDEYLLADMRTRERGWLTYEFDAQRPEEIAVDWFNPSYRVLEGWLSLDRPEDRDARGRPSRRLATTADLKHVELRADLRRFANESPQGAAKVRPVDARIQARLELELARGGDRVLQLFLHPWAKVERVSDDRGTELEFLRHHIGKRSSAIERKVYDNSLVVLFDRPLRADDPLSLEVSFELELIGYAPGRGWYPSVSFPGSGLADRHTARLELTCRDSFQVRATGRLEGETTAKGLRTTTWTIDRPLKMMSFVFAKRHHEEIFPGARNREVAAFSSLGGFVSPERIRELGTDVLASLEFFQELFASDIPEARLYAALIPAVHGQAFDGLLHIGDVSTLTGRVAEQELFRAHEVAHLWWGHELGWHGYRDQWLSEGFAHYSAMMFVEAAVERGRRYFDEMLKSYSDELTGSIESRFSQFNRAGVALLNRRAADRIGPIGHGSRCVVGEAPTAYRSQIYKKGALVLHMLRMNLRAVSGSDEAFLEVLRAFLERHRGGHPTTADFQAVLEATVPGDWSWFFDQWVFGAEIPTYLWRHRVIRADSGFTLRLRVEQRDVPPGFRMAVPVAVEYADGERVTLLAPIRQALEELEFPLARQPREVIFNPQRAVLARARKN